MRLPFPLRHHLQASFPTGGIRPCLPGRVVAIECCPVTASRVARWGSSLLTRSPFLLGALQSVAGLARGRAATPAGNRPAQVLRHGYLPVGLTGVHAWLGRLSVRLRVRIHSHSEWQVCLGLFRLWLPAVSMRRQIRLDFVMPIVTYAPCFLHPM